MTIENIFSAGGWLNQSLASLNDALWTYVVLVLLIGCALWFSFKTRLVQVRMLPEMVRLLGEGTRKDGGRHVSSFQAFAISIASRVGTGNLAGVATACVFGGIRRIARVSSVLVPLMAVLYVVLAASIIIMNAALIPHVFKVIIENAFGLQPFAGGTLGMTMMNGIKRGLFSNEAGEGSAPNIAASADVSHPVKQGLVQSLGVFTDTLLVCSCTAFIILISGVYTHTGLNGIQLTQAALQGQVGAAGTAFVAIAILLFAFSSIIGNYTYGEMNVKFLTPKRGWIVFLRLMNGAVMVFFGAMASLDLVWSIGDLFMGCVTIVNLVAIVVLGRQAFFLLDDYLAQKRSGVKSPTFHRSQMPEIEKEIACWD